MLDAERSSSHRKVELPVLDLDLFINGDEEQRRNISQQAAESAATNGAFLVQGAGINAELFTGMTLGRGCVLDYANAIADSIVAFLL